MLQSKNLLEGIFALEEFWARGVKVGKQLEDILELEELQQPMLKVSCEDQQLEDIDMWEEIWFNKDQRISNKLEECRTSI